jgi:hypothetical protein
LFGLFEKRFWAVTVTIGDSPNEHIGKIMVKFMDKLWQHYETLPKNYSNFWNNWTSMENSPTKRCLMGQ